MQRWRVKIYEIDYTRKNDFLLEDDERIVAAAFGKAGHPTSERGEYSVLLVAVLSLERGT